MLNSTQINNLYQYKYSSNDNSLYTKLFSSTINKIPTYLNPQLTPNLISLIGFMFQISAYLISKYYLNYKINFYISYFLIFICYNCYMFCDSLDGAVARYHNKSSVLGELVDHGLDSIGAGLIMLTITNLMNSNWITKNILLFVCLIMFNLSHFEALNKKLSFGIIGPFESIYFLMLLPIINPFLYIPYLNKILLYIIITYYGIKTNIFYLLTLSSLLLNIFISLIHQNEINLFSIIIMSCAWTVSLIIAKVTKSNPTNLITVFMMLSIIDPRIGIVLSILYIYKIIYEVKQILNINLFD